MKMMSGEREGERERERRGALFVSCVKVPNRILFGRYTASSPLLIRDTHTLLSLDYIRERQTPIWAVWPRHYLRAKQLNVCTFHIVLLHPGRSARPAQPLTTAAVINGCTIDHEEMVRREEEEQLKRIRDNLRERKTVSSALLKVLMP